MSRWLHLSYFLVLLLTVIPLFVFVRNHLPSSTEINCSQAKSTDRELKTLLASLRESELKALLANAGSEAATTVNTKQPQPKFVALNSTQLPSLSAGRLADAAESDADADADAGADAEADAESDGESRTGDRGGLHSPSPLHSPLPHSPLVLTTAALTNTSLTHCCPHHCRPHQHFTHPLLPSPLCSPLLPSPILNSPTAAS